MSVRPARPDDVPQILDMIRELADYERALHEVRATEDQLRASLFGPQPAVFCLVAESVSGPDSAPDSAPVPSAYDGGAAAGPELAGFALWFLNFSTWLGRHGVYLEDLYVRPGHRRAGHGRALLGELARLCVERGYGRLEWWVLDWNSPARDFYRSLGAEAMDEWTVHRLTGRPLATLAAAKAAKEAPGTVGREPDGLMTAG